MPKRLIALIAVISVAACSEPKFAFRGYTERSSCEEVINLELAGGAEFEGAYDSDEPERPGQIAELSGMLFSETVRIDVLCTPAGFVQYVRYVSPAYDPMETGPVFRRLAAELDVLLGTPVERLNESMRGRYYLCTPPSPVALEEWKLPLEAGQTEEEHEVYLTVVPWDIECLPDD